MILELLRAEPDLLRTFAVALRLAYYVACLGAVGLVLFAIGFERFQEPEHVAASRRLIAVLAAAGVVIGFVWLGTQVSMASDGDPFDAEIWDMMLTARPGISVLMAVAGLLTVVAASRTTALAKVPGTAGVLAVAASFAAVGHTTQHQPRELLAAVLVLHLVAVAFWAGSLVPLAQVSHRGGPEAARLVESWARAAAWVVGGLVLAGLLLAWFLVGRLEVLFTTRYGLALLTKVALVGVLLGFAAWHRFRLTPDLAANTPGAGSRLARSIWWEVAVMLLVFWAVAEMTSTSPQGDG